MEKGKAVQNKLKLNNLQKELKEKNRLYYYLFLIAFNLGLKLEKVVKLTRRETEEIADKRSNDILDEDSLFKIKEYLNQFGEDDYIFQNFSDRKGDYPDLNKVYDRLEELAKKEGIDDFGNETLQKSYAYFHYQRYQDIDRIKDILGLVSPTATLHYMGYEDDRYLCFHCNRGCIYRKKYK